MKRRAFTFFGLLMAVGTSPVEAHAAEVYYETTIITIATDSKSEANVIQLPFNIATNCDLSSISRAYIRKENKHMFATALTAASQGLSVNVGIETDAPPLAIHATLPSPLKCEVFQIIAH